MSAYENAENIDLLFVAGFGPIARDPAASRKFYSETLALQFKEDANGYLYTGALDGVKHLALWSLSQAAESCFGMGQWRGDLPVPRAWIEFDVENIEKATAELKSQGYELLVATRKEPWAKSSRGCWDQRSAGGHNPYASNAKVNSKIDEPSGVPVTARESSIQDQSTWSMSITLGPRKLT